MMLKFNIPICYLNLNFPKLELKCKLKSGERKLKNITQNCIKGLVDEEENNTKLDIYYLSAKFHRDRCLRVESAPMLVLKTIEI